MQLSDAVIVHAVYRERGVCHDGHRAVRYEQPHGVRGRQPGPLHVSGAVAAQVRVERILRVLDVARLDHRLGYVRPADGSPARQLFDPLPRHGHIQFGETLYHPARPALPAVTKLAQGALQPHVLVVDEVSQHVYLAARHVGAELHADNDLQVPVAPCGSQRFAHTLRRIVVGDRGMPDAVGGAQVHDLGRRESAVREGGVQVEVCLDHLVPRG